MKAAGIVRRDLTDNIVTVGRVRICDGGGCGKS